MLHLRRKTVLRNALPPASVYPHRQSEGSAHRRRTDIGGASENAGHLTIVIEVDFIKQYPRHLSTVTDDTPVSDGTTADIAIIADPALISDEDISVQNRTVRYIVVRTGDECSVDNDTRSDYGVFP